jgi:hypothetical protein
MLYGNKSHKEDATTKWPHKEKGKIRSTGRVFFTKHCSLPKLLTSFILQTDTLPWTFSTPARDDIELKRQARTRYDSRLFHAPGAMLIRSALFWGITQRRAVILYRRFGTTYRSYLQGSRSLDGYFIFTPCIVLDTYHHKPTNGLYSH